MNFEEKYTSAVIKNNSLVCVGLDTDYKKIPSRFKNKEFPLFEFNKEIVDNTFDLVSAYKPNTAFYEAYGSAGIEQLKLTCDYIYTQHGEIPIILDAKRGDIGNTNLGYIQFAFDYLPADAITLHPYLGKDALQPFLEQADKGCIILCKTSNPGSSEIQNLDLSGKPLYQMIAEKVVHDWNVNHNCLLVVGATYPEELAVVRKTVGEMTILVPGIGSQGGDLEKTLQAGLNKNKSGLIISASRNIIYASSGEDFAQWAREVTTKLRDEINSYRV